MKKTTRTLLVSSMALCLSTAIAVGATYALFTGGVTVNNHLKAGNLKVGLLRTAYQECVLNDDGLLEVLPVDETEIDLTKNPKKLFTVTNAVPECWYQATLYISNEGSVAFDYGMSILWDETNATKAQKEFAEQIEISITYGATPTVTTFALNQCAENEIDLGYLLKGEDAEVIVKATFKDDADNDLVQNKSINFDVQVFAEQKVSL